jgi:ATP-binding cassette subfamily A (ABC1) protein 3
VLTTHFMEEADALSDRIAIMNHGQVRCCGTPLFLKNTFGSGYRLTLAKNKSFNQDSFKSLLNEFLKTYKIETNIAAELTVAVPFEDIQMLPQLLTEIDSKKVDLDIDGYGISSPTIEEVFIK